MKAILAIAFAVLLFSSAFAAQFTAFFLPQPPPFSQLNSSWEGHFGSYRAESGAGNPFPYISISGRDASTASLALELDYLKNASLLKTDCNASEIAGSNGTDFLCTPEGWNICPQGSVCSFTGAPAPPMPQAYVPSSQGTAAPEGGASAPLEIMGVSNSQAASDRAGGSAQPPTASPAQPGISLGQMLQLGGALIAIVVVSYLALQQRQVQIEAQIDPQEEKLLDNETRAGIMQELSNADRIPTDLSIKLGKSKATVVEHLTALTSAGFVERVSTPGRKYVFYKLTQKGKRALLRWAG